MMMMQQQQQPGRPILIVSKSCGFFFKKKNLSSNQIFKSPQMLMAQNPSKFGWMIKQGGGKEFVGWFFFLFLQLNKTKTTLFCFLPLIFCYSKSFIWCFLFRLGFKSWKRRFFVLVNDRLYYFEKENSKEPAGVLTLDRSTTVNNTFVKGKQNWLD